MSHGDAIVAAPPGFVVTASSPGAPVAALEDPDRAVYGVQFHPEVAHTERGQDDAQGVPVRRVRTAAPRGPTRRSSSRRSRDPRAGGRRARASAGCRAASTRRSPPRSCTRRSATSSRACSSTPGCCAWTRPTQVEETFRRDFHVDLVHVKAADRFLGALDDVIDPEAKRKIIGETFIRVFEEAARDLAEQRRRPALPGAGHALPRHRRVGRRRQRQHQVAPQRGRPARRHGLRAGRAAAPPVQGRGAGGRRGARPARGHRVAPAVPGARLAVRIIGTITPERVEILRQADAVVVDEIRRPGCTARSGRASPCCPRCGPSA